MIKKNLFLYFFIFQILLLFYLFNFYYDLTIWSVINKVLLFESSTTSLELLKQKNFPLFSFDVNLGFPIFADSQHGLFEPINFLFLILFGPLEQINYSFFLHLILFISSLFFLLHRIYNIDFNVALVVSILNVFSPIIVGDATHQNHLATVSYIPLSLILIEVFLLKDKFKNFILLFSPIVCFQLLSGHYQYQLYCFIFYALYFLISIFQNLNPLKKTLYQIIIFFLSFIIGFAFSAFQLLPSLDLMLSGDRSNFDSTFLGSSGFSVIAVYFKPLSKFFNNIEGTISTISYVFIFLFSINKLLISINLKKIDFDKVAIKYFLIFFSILILSFGQNLEINNFIYKLIPFLENFRFPQRFMQINSFCSIILLAIALNEFNKINFKVEYLKISILVILAIFILTFLHFSKYIFDENYFVLSKLNIFLIFYPFMFIYISYLLIKFFEINTKTKFFLIIFFYLSILENTMHIMSFKQYSLFFKKEVISKNQNNSNKICDYNKTNSINIVGEFNDTEFEYLTNIKDFRYYSLLSSAKCKVFYHHSREDVTLNGLGYNQSSLSTHQMAHLSKYNQKFLKKIHLDFEKKKNKYIASFLQNFVNSKVFYIDNNHIIKDDLGDYDMNIIKQFILDYKFTRSQKIFDKFKPYFLDFLNTNLGNKIKNFYPKIKINDLKIIDFKNFKFIPLWQSGDFYVLKDNKFENLKTFSFGYKINNSSLDNYIYYIPISFNLGLLISFIFLSFYVFIYFYYLIRKYK
jgi:hypothetical protein